MELLYVLAYADYLRYLSVLSLLFWKMIC
uniref:Uncharacterized protein n=1 Tax=Rhizophora mucronata TaxID=61149 RepID=A0A2P2LT55_RHIMU